MELRLYHRTPPCARWACRSRGDVGHRHAKAAAHRVGPACVPLDGLLDDHLACRTADRLVDSRGDHGADGRRHRIGRVASFGRSLGRTARKKTSRKRAAVVHRPDTGRNDPTSFSVL